MRIFTTIVIASVAFIEADAAPKKNQQVTTEMADSVTVTLCDCVANVEVRAMSFGPGACALKIRSPQGETDILSLPGKWSEWVTVYTSSAEQSVTIEREIVCDTGARTQLRYWK